MSMALVVREAHQDEMQTLWKWFDQEQWNPGVNDVKTLFSIKSGHFFVGLINEKIVSCISALVYQSHYAFIGYYVVEPESLRGRGYGTKTWDYAFDYLEHNGIKNCGLDGVIDQIENYGKKGFIEAYLHQRHYYEVNGDESKADKVSFEPPTCDELTTFDKQYVAETRSGCVKAWLTIDPTRKHAVAHGKKDNLLGYAALRKASDGYRIGPVYSSAPDLAIDLIRSLCSGLPRNTHVYLDIPEANTKKDSFIKMLGLKPVGFDCMRMYKGDPPSVNLDEIYAVSSIEMG